MINTLKLLYKKMAFFIIAMSLNIPVVLANKNVSSYNYVESNHYSITSHPSASFDSMTINSNAEELVSHFNTFEVNAKPLVIYLPKSSKVKTLIISANTIKLKNKISIIGRPLNLILVTPTNEISCNNCKFDNASRITLSVGQYNNKIINANNRGTVTINNLSAPGVQSLEVISANINTAGIIDLNLKAQKHPKGGFVLYESGNYIIGAGGINLYAGDFTINYTNLDILSGSKSTSVYKPSGTFKAASIGIISSSSIEIPASTVLNTMSDALSSSTRQGDFYIPSEGIFIQIAQNTSATLNIKGKLYSDRIITTKNQGHLTISKSAKVMAKTIKVLTKGNINNLGYIEADDIGLNSGILVNTGQIRGTNLNIETAKDVYNSFGGSIQVNKFKATLESGVFTNGSRSNKSYRPSSQVLKTPSIDLTSSKHGIYQTITETGTIQSNLSAFINANEIRINAKAIENINPYHIKKAVSDNWDSGIKINSQAANQVAMKAETYMGLKATNYIRNSSAILGLNQSGTFDVNTIKFYNERYRLEADAFIVSQLTLDSEKTGKYDEANIGTETKITVYSPPGRIYSYGKLKVSDGNNTNGDEQLTNAFSYLEVFSDSHFHQLELSTIGLQLTQALTQTKTARIRHCLMWSSCSDKQITTNAEAETLLSLQGNVYGINQQVLSETNYTQDNSNVLAAKTQEAINTYLAQFIWHKRDDYFSAIIHSKTTGDWLTGTQKICNGTKRLPWVGVKVPNCYEKSFRQSISSLLETSVENNHVGNTGYSHKEINTAATKFSSKLPKKIIPSGQWSQWSHYMLSHDGNSFRSYALSSDEKTISVTYVQYGKAATPGIGKGYLNYSFTFTEVVKLTDVMKHL